EAAWGTRGGNRGPPCGRTFLPPARVTPPKTGAPAPSRPPEQILRHTRPGAWAPRAAPGRARGAPVAQPEPAALAPASMGTNGPRSRDGTRAAGRGGGGAGRRGGGGGGGPGGWGAPA